MIEVYKIVSGKYDSVITLTLIKSDTHRTRGNDLRLQKSNVKYDMRKFYFTNRVVDHWNSLPNWVVTVTSLGVIITVCFGGVCSGRQDIVYRVAGGLLWRMCDIHRCRAGGGGHVSRVCVCVWQKRRHVNY